MPRIRKAGDPTSEAAWWLYRHSTMANDEEQCEELRRMAEQPAVRMIEEIREEEGEDSE